MRKKLIGTLAVILLAGAGRAYCAAPDTLVYQGRLKEVTGLVSGSYSLEIKLCPDETGNDVACVTTGAQSVSVSSGLFRSTFTVPSNVDLNTGVWYMQVVAAGSPLAPRERLTSAAYSIYATTATGLSAAPNTVGAYVSTNIYVAGFSSATAYYGDGSSLTNVSTHSFKIGDSYGGGIVFRVDSAGKQVLIAATADQSSGIKWSNTSTLIGASRDAVYVGMANTVMISTMQGPGSYAARLCEDYSATVNGEYYDDWYLPSLTELNLMYSHIAIIGGFSLAENYWSSTEDAFDKAWTVYFGGGGNVSDPKTLNTSSVRCIRAGPSTPIGNLPTNFETVTNGAYLSKTQVFSGSNTFSNVAADTMTVIGEARLARNLTQVANTGISLTTADFGKTITIDSASDQTVSLPAVGAAEIGATITMIKLGAGKISIAAWPATFIADSAGGGIIYNDAVIPAYAVITLRLADAFHWIPVAGSGSWLTDTGTEYALGCTAGNCGGSWPIADTGLTVHYSTAAGDDSDYQPADSQPSYTDNGDGTVTDNRTGLMWVRDPVAASISAADTWENAINACESGIGNAGTYAGYTDWRLPNAKELVSIADYSGANPTINATYFLNTVSASYWSSTSVQALSIYAWILNFANGTLGPNDKISAVYVRCVRGGR